MTDLSVLTTMTNLTSLQINSYYAVDPLDFSSMTNLNYVAFTCRRCATVPSFAGLPLQSLSILIGWTNPAMAVYLPSNLIAGITTLTSFRLLTRSTNQYGTEWVPDFTNNTGLTEIELSGNNFTTETFANFDFSKLTALTRFDVSDNPRLSKLPPSLSACTLLEILLAYKCALNHADSFPDMRNTKVSVIYAYNNGISTLPNAFCQLSNWVKNSGTNFTLYLYENPLGSLPSCFSSYQIDRIELSETSFSSFPSVLFSSYLQGLSWENNDRRMTLGAVDLSKWRESIKEVTLENTQIEGPFLNGLAGAPFYGLSADGNQFTGTIADNFFSGGKMEYFHISGSSLTGPFPTSVGLSTNLDGIYAAGNKFTSVPDSIANLYKLQVLDFSDNDLRSIPMSNSVWESMSLLHEISIGGNRGLTGSIPTSWVSGTELYNVNASYCSFRGDHPAINSTILYKLFLSGNFLDGTIKEPIKVGYLQDWYFDQNSLQGSIPTSVGNNTADLDWTALRSFNASYNRLTGPLPTFFREGYSLRNIEQLHINNNGLSGALPNFEYLYNVESFMAHTNFFNICQANPFFSQGDVSPDECSVINNPYFGGCYCPEYFQTFCQADYTCPPPGFVQVPLGEAPTPVLPPPPRSDPSVPTGVAVQVSANPLSFLLLSALVMAFVH